MHDRRVGVCRQRAPGPLLEELQRGGGVLVVHAIEAVNLVTDFFVG